MKIQLLINSYSLSYAVNLPLEEPFLNYFITKLCQGDPYLTRKRVVICTTNKQISPSEYKPSLYVQILNPKLIDTENVCK